MAFSGLAITTSPTVDSLRIRTELLRGVLMLLQYDGNTIGHCDCIQELESLSSSREGAPPGQSTVPQCLVAFALRCQILGSIGWPVDLEPLERACGEHAGLYHPWEIRHFTSVIVFCKERNFKKTVALAAESLRQEPRDIFSVRLMFVGAFLSGEYLVAKEALFCVLSSAGLSTIEDCNRLHDALSDSSLAAVARDQSLLETYLPNQLLLSPHPQSVMGLLFLPYVVTYYAFTVEESSHMGTALSNAASAGISENAQLVDQASMWNDLSLRLVCAFNAVRGVKSTKDPLIGSLPPFTHPFAMHVVCHVFDSKGDPAGGIRAIEYCIPKDLWVGTAHLVVHCWWHVALFHFDLGDLTEALDIFDTRIMPAVAKEDPFGISDATAFLTRAVIHGSLNPQEDPRFAAVNRMWEYHFGDRSRLLTITQFPFFHAHLLMSLWTTASGTRPELPHRGSSSSTVTKLSACFDVISCTNAATNNMHSASDAAFAVANYIAGQVEWIELGGSAAQRDILQRLCVFFLQSAKKSQSEASSSNYDNQLWDPLFSSVKSAVDAYVQRFPKQAYYVTLWEKEIKFW